MARLVAVACRCSARARRDGEPLSEFARLAGTCAVARLDMAVDAPHADDPPVAASEPADTPQTLSALVPSSSSSRSDHGSCAHTLHDNHDTSGQGVAGRALEGNLEGKGESKNVVAGDEDEDSGMQPVRRRVTTGTVAPPPYTIHSHRMRWFVVSLVALAGLFSCVQFLFRSSRFACHV